MSTTYPGSKQSFTNPIDSDYLNDPNHASQHANENDTVAAIQDKLGITDAILNKCGGLKPNADSTTAIQLQESDGTNVLNVDTTNGRVGIGDTAPGVKLHVYGGEAGTSPAWNANDHLIVEGAGYSFIQIHSDPSSIGGLQFTDAARGIGQIQYSHSDDSMRFITSSAEQVRITNDGNVGIGTTTPNRTLVLEHATPEIGLDATEGVNGYPRIYTYADRTSDGQGSFDIQVYNNGATPIAAFQANRGSTDLKGEIAFRTSNVERMRIDEDGNVGIGLTSPTASCHIDQSSTTGAKPVLTLDQGDVSEEFVKFIGTSAIDNTQSLVDAADLTTPGSIVGWIRVYVQDDAASGAITDGIYYCPFYDTPTA